MDMHFIVLLEKVAIANALQLEASRRRTFSALLRCHAKFEVTQPIHCRITEFLLLIPYVTL